LQPAQGNNPRRPSLVISTEKGIFSTPLIDSDGSIYIGSADHYFYALKPDGTLIWSFETGEIIDSAPALQAVKPGYEVLPNQPH
jgi:outer membrane protein assembly factor BamB